MQRPQRDEETSPPHDAVLTQEDNPKDRVHLVLYASLKPIMAERRPQLMKLSPVSLIVRVHKLLSPGQQVRVTIHLLNTGCDIGIEARVVKVNHAVGEMTMRIVTIDGDGAVAIAKYINHPSAPR